MMKTTIKKHNPTGWIWLFLLPTLILYTIYTILPIIASVCYSFMDWVGYSKKGTFVGLENYIELFQDNLFWNAMKNTFLFLLYAVPGRFLASFMLALLLTSKLTPAKSVFRTMIFIPVVTTGAIIGTIMTMIFNPGNGPVNLILEKLHLIDSGVSFLGNGDTALTTSAVIWIWKWIGTSLIYWIASLQSIPDELYEAATVDGAGTFMKFRAITLPLLVPYAALIFILTLSDAMKVFDLMLTLTGGGPFFRTEVIELFIYRHAFTSSSPRIGYASAAATVFGLIFVAITLIRMIPGRKEKTE